LVRTLLDQRENARKIEGGTAPKTFWWGGITRKKRRSGERQKKGPGDPKKTYGGGLHNGSFRENEKAKRPSKTGKERVGGGLSRTPKKGKEEGTLRERGQKGGLGERLGPADTTFPTEKVRSYTTRVRNKKIVGLRVRGKTETKISKGTAEKKRLEKNKNVGTGRFGKKKKNRRVRKKDAPAKKGGKKETRDHKEEGACRTGVKTR